MPEGVYVANVTPFKDDDAYTIDTEAYMAHVEWLSEKGITGIVPFGTNGEGPSVAMSEKLEVLKKLFDRDLRVEIIPTITQGTLPETLEMLEALDELPAAAVLVLPPYYIKPVTAEGLKRFYEPVLAATRHPVIVYHIPKYALPVPAEVIEELPVWGVKDSGGEEGYAEGLLAAGKGVLIGTEDDLWARLNLGAQGMISALANFIPERIVEMYEKAKTGDEDGGKELCEQLQEVRMATKEYAAPSLLKRLGQARHGADMGMVRPPLVPAPDDYDPNSVLELAETAYR